MVKISLKLSNFIPQNWFDLYLARLCALVRFQRWKRYFRRGKIPHLIDAGIRFLHQEMAEIDEGEHPPKNP